MKKIIVTEEELRELALCTELNSNLSLGRMDELGNKGFSLFLNSINIEAIGKMLDNVKGMIVPNKEKSLFMDTISQTFKFSYSNGKFKGGGVSNWFSAPSKNTLSLSIRET